MDNLKRYQSLRVKQERLFYEDLEDCSDEEVRRSSEFVKKVKEKSDKRIFAQYVQAMKSYESRSLSDVDLKRRIVHILGDCEELLKEFHQLLSTQKAKSDVERRVEECRNVTPSYWISREAEDEKPSSSDEVLNGKYFSAVEYDPEKGGRKRQPWHNVSSIKSEDRMFEDHRFLEALISVVEFGREKDGVCNKPPPRFNEVVNWFYGGRVPLIFKTDPKSAVQAILPQLQLKGMRMMQAKNERNLKIYIGRSVRNG